VPAEKIRLAGGTLRDDKQRAGIVFTRDDRLASAGAPDVPMMHTIEAGTPAVSLEDRAALEAIVGLGLGAPPPGVRGREGTRRVR
jgi:isopropylmalate/homocitrate/citramalate synthase